MAFEIEKGVALPDSGRTKKGERLYPFGKMEVGDSFVVPKNGHKSWAFLHVATTKAQKECSIRLTTRAIDDENKRVWRTE